MIGTGGGAGVLQGLGERRADQGGVGRGGFAANKVKRDDEMSASAKATKRNAPYRR